MKDEEARKGLPATIDITASERSSDRRRKRCVRCQSASATTTRRTVSYLGTWNRPERVCDSCATELDDLGERCARGMLEVDRAVRRYRKAA
jgi:hypothetical protein